MNLSRLICFSTILVSASTGVSAFDAVNVEFKDGTKTQVVLSDDLTASFTAGELVITDIQASLEIRVDKADISAFSFEDLSSLDAVGAESVSAVVSGCMLTVSGMNGPVDIILADTNGRVISSVTAGATYSFDLRDLVSGVYLVKIGTVTYKISVK